MRYLLKSKSGSIFPFAIALLIASMIISLTVLQTFKVYAYAGRAKQIMTDALSTCAENNYEASYYGLREGITSAYIPDGMGNFTSGIDNQAVNSYLISMGFKSKSSGYIKNNVSGNEMYSIVDVKITTTDSADGSLKLKETASFTFSTPFPIAGYFLPYISIPMTVSGGYVTKY